jgi:hypothetical protein
MAGKDDLIPLWFRAKFGGSLKFSKASKSHFGTTWVWYLWCNKAADFLETIIPYLKYKQNRAKLAVELARLHRRRGGNVSSLTDDELSRRELLATGIRKENSYSNARVKLVSKGLLN